MFRDLGLVATDLILLMPLIQGTIGNIFVVEFMGAGANLLAGFMMGPVYPSAVIMLMRHVGANERVAAIAIMSGFGRFGAAAVPFVAMELTNTFEHAVLSPIVIGLLGVMVAIWLKLPQQLVRRV